MGNRRPDPGFLGSQVRRVRERSGRRGGGAGQRRTELGKEGMS